ncbi:MAG: YceD family protein [Tepidimonas sp.]|uniref:YceD family protein n=1 Tax=Tepidimonas sp. TaxID=2002775 RepID=UPI00259E972A|nr:YceD family protein [Tepidimonas sp.]MDM7455717.1 YceD family protein [Tepidimonas sp.]
MNPPKPHADESHDWIDVDALTRRGEALSGAFALARLPRVLADAPDGLGLAEEAVRWRVHAEWRDPPAAVAAAVRALAGGRRAAVPRQLWLHLWAEGRVPLVCQRCLEPYWQPVTVDRWFRFVADEATAEAQDGSCEEDLLVLDGPRYPLRELVEEELLLAVPIVPLHAVCPRPIPLAAGDTLGAGPQTPSNPSRPNPFAALTAWKPPR